MQIRSAERTHRGVENALIASVVLAASQACIFMVLSALVLLGRWCSADTHVGIWFGIISALSFSQMFGLLPASMMCLGYCDEVHFRPCKLDVPTCLLCLAQSWPCITTIDVAQGGLKGWHPGKPCFVDCPMLLVWNLCRRCCGRNRMCGIWARRCSFAPRLPSAFCSLSSFSSMDGVCHAQAGFLATCWPSARPLMLVKLQS